ncbi:MAG: hypothetical protein WCL14_00700, partial [Bacteroidota bacterium]
MNNSILRTMKHVATLLILLAVFGLRANAQCPNLDPIAGNADVCANTTQTYSVTPIVGADYYTWTLPSGWSGISTTPSINVSFDTNDGLITVTYHSAGCGGDSPPQFLAITVHNPICTIVPSGPTIFCYGGSVTLDAGVFMGYSWSDGSTNETLDVTTDGFYSVTVVDASGCTATAIQQVSVNAVPNPVITGNGPFSFCPGGSVTLDAGVYDSYLWSNGSTDEFVVANSTDTYSVTVTGADLCTGAATQTTTLNSAPFAVVMPQGPPTFCQGGSVVLKELFAFPIFHWSTGGTDNQVTVSASGTYTITVTDGNNCTGTASQLVTVYPNPTTTVTGDGPTTFCMGSSVNLDGGAGFSAYSWSNGDVTETSHVTATGTYRVTVTDSHGCTGTASADVFAIQLVNTITPSGSTSFCFGTSLILDAGIYDSYSWSTTETTETISSSVSGNYSVTVVDGSGCTGVASITITEESQVVATTTNTEPNCLDQLGRIVAHGAGGAGFYNYSDNGGSTYQASINFPNLTAGTYIVVVKDLHGCTGTISTTLTDAPGPSVTITPDGPTTFCTGGTVNLNAGVHTTYLWSTAETTQSIAANTGGTYTLTVTNAQGCTGTGSANVTVVTSLNPMITANGPTTFCTGGSVILDAGTFLTYAWSNGDVTQTTTITTSGTYVVTVTETGGCTGTATQIVTVDANLTPVITANGATTFCAGGSVTLDAGSYPSYSWSNGATNETTTINISGTYNVTVTLYSGCTGSASQLVTLNANPAPTITPGGPTSFCNGGSVVLDAGVYAAYIWNTGDTDQTLTAYSGGIYEVTVTDGNGCIGSASMPVTVYSIATTSITANGPTTFCVGGSVSLDAGSFVSYLWSTTETTNPIIVSTTGNYIVTVTDINSCTATASQAVTVNLNLSPSITPIGATTFCSGGSVILDAGTYTTYSWNNGGTSETITPSTSNTYSVTVSDATGCTGIATQVVTVNPLPTPSITPTGAITFCSGGSVDLDAGTFASYLWSNSSTDEIISANASGTYVVTVTDGNGCTGTTSQLITVNSLPTAAITGGNSFCAGGSLNLSAGTFSSYSWSTAETTSSINVSSANTYSVTVTDGNGCTATASQVVTVNSLPTPTVVPGGSTTFCNGGSVSLDAGAYASYIWNTGDTDQTITAFSAGTYMVTVTDNNGCEGNASISITVNPLPTPTITHTTPTSFCSGGSVVLDAGTYTSYIWSNAGTDQTTTASTDGNFVVTVTDGNGCQGIASIAVTVFQLPTPVITSSGPTTICSGDSLILGTSVSYASYIWSNAATTDTIHVFTTDNYIATVTDINGCTGSASLAVNVGTSLAPVITPSGSTTFCAGGSVTLNTGTYNSYAWSNGGTGQSINVTSSGTYSVTVSNSGGCTGVTSQSVTVNTNPTPTITHTNPTTFCAGGSVTLAAGSFVSYIWSSSETTQTIDVSASGTYSVTVSDLNGCIGTTSQAVVVNANPTPVISANGPTTFCSGDSVRLSTTTYSSYIWSTGATTNGINVLTTNTYSLTVNDNNGCIGQSSQLVTVNANPVLAITHIRPTTFCTGDSVVLDAGTHTSYHWNTGSTNETITAIYTATYSVTVANGFGCTATASIPVLSSVIPTPVIFANGPTTFCAGGSVNLNAGVYAQYIWGNGATTQIITVTASGTYPVTVTNAGGCTGTSTITVTVNANPSTTITGSPTTFCAGGSVTLNAGTFSLYHWSTGASIQTILVNASGIYSVTVSNASGCTSTASQTVTVNANPAPVITPSGPISFCTGGSVNL